MKKALKVILFSSLIALILGLMFVNLFCIKNENFWNMSIESCLTLVIALVVSYYFTQKNQDERNKKEIYLHLMEKMQRLVSEDCLSNISENTDINIILMKKREINNCTTTLEKYAKEFHIEEEVQFISDKVREYTEFFGTHQDDVAYLAKSTKELKRPLDIIEQKLNEAMIKIFD